MYRVVSMKMWAMMIAMAMFFVLLSPGANAEEFKVLEVSKNGVYCQILNPSLECQLIDNQVSVTIRSNVKDMDADLDMICGKTRIPAYADTCNRTENVYTCYFSIDPLLRLEKAEPLACGVDFHFYKKFSNESLGSEKYEGNFVITPVYENTLLSISRQKTKLLNDFIAVKNFDKEAMYNSGICSYLGTGILFSKIGKYEEEFQKLGGVVGAAKTSSARSLNLLANSSVLASLYAENGDPFFSPVLEIFLLHGLHTGNFISQIIYQLSEGYITGGIFENLQMDVDGSCEQIRDNFGHLLNPNFILMKKVRLIDCIEKRDFENCWRKLAEMEDYVNPGSSPQRAELRFYVGNRLLRDNSNLCNGSEIRLKSSELERFVVDRITIKGPGEQKPCKNVILLNGVTKTYSVPEFLCGPDNKPLNSKRYSIEINPGAFGEKVEYNINYYADPDNCRVQQEVIPV